MAEVQIQNFINNEFRTPKNGQYLDSYDPSVGEVWAQVPNSGPEDAVDAIVAAKAAYKTYVRALSLP